MRTLKQSAISLVAFVGAGAALACPAFAQSSDASPETTKPIAFVYISNVINPNVTGHALNVYAYSVAANGALTPIQGSPFKDNLFKMSVDGKYLFGTDDNADIESFSISSTGALQKVSSIDPDVYNPGGCGDYGTPRVDHSGSFLYNPVVDPDCFGTHFQYFKVNSSTGKLTYTGQTDELGVNMDEIDFLGNNNYAYAPICTIYDHEEVGYITGLQRHSNGSMAEINIGNYGPYPKNTDNAYCPLTFATDPTNHMAALLQEEDEDGDIYGLPVIAVYTVASNGDLLTSSTYHNMGVASTVVGQYNEGYMRMSPSGKLLAVGGSKGLEIFHFNGGSQVTKMTTLLSGHSIENLTWDNSNHLYVPVYDHIGSGKLYVYTVTPTGVTLAPGSPYSIPNPFFVAVKPM